MKQNPVNHLLRTILLTLAYYSLSLTHLNAQTCINCTSTDPINTGLLACYPFNGNANDESGSGNNVISNTATLSTDRFGRANSAYQFNGSSGQFIKCTNANMPSGANARTISLWVKYDGVVVAGQTLVAFAYGTQTTSNAQMVGLISSKVRYIGWANEHEVSYSYNDSSWIHIVTTYQNGTASIYVNGTLLGSAAKTWNTLTSAELFIGTRPDTLNSFFNGKIDDIRIYNRALSAAEISRLYSSPIPSPITTSSNSICRGDSVQLSTANIASQSYSWAPSSTIANPTSPVTMARPMTTTKYYLTVSKGICSVLDSVTIHVDSIALSAGSDISLCLGDSFNLTASGATSYSWAPSSGLSNAAIANPIAKPSKTTFYTVKGVSGVCSSYDTVIATVCVCNQLTKYDTVLTNVFDTTHITIMDTSRTMLFDTTHITIMDTLRTMLFDTTHITLRDTTFITITDTFHVTIRDTVSIAVTDTLIIEIFSGMNPPTGILSTIKVYPNPSHDKVFISIDHFAQIPNHSIKVVNTLGQTVFSNAIDQQNLVIDVSALGGPGAYFLQILSPSGQAIDTRKIIIR